VELIDATRAETDRGSGFRGRRQVTARVRLVQPGGDRARCFRPQLRRLQLPIVRCRTNPHWNPPKVSRNQTVDNLAGNPATILRHRDPSDRETGTNPAQTL